MSNITNIVSQMYSEGLSDEEYIMKCIESAIGGTCEKASKIDDVSNHIDFWWTTPKNILVSIDAKGLHRNKRNDNTYSDNHWIEIKNVQGNNGWVYGKEDYIAFRTQNEILFVKPKKLIDIYESRVINNELVFDTPKECYIPYQRRKYGRKDIMFKMPNKDIKEVSHFVIFIK